MGVNSDQDKLKRWVEVFDCEVDSPPSYLGLPLSGNPKATTFWDPICGDLKEAGSVEEGVPL